MLEKRTNLSPESNPGTSTEIVVGSSGAKLDVLAYKSGSAILKRPVLNEGVPHSQL
jgi:hypothetical protein